jgi:hypothetical protein
MMNRSQLIAGQNNKKLPSMFMTMRIGRQQVVFAPHFFINRFTDENTSHGRIRYAGRILSYSIGSQDGQGGRKVIIMFHTCPKHNFFVLSLVRCCVTASDKR